ncbi:MAG: GNAT family N-acetyltransferase [Bacteroidales bacterium]|nr:GNAT family N-acetyltransferase [Bacteroidales bacterium]
MNFESLKNSKHISFAKEIYNSSFPLDERRNFDLVIEMVGKEGFDFYVIKSSLEDETPTGIISIWEFDEFAYIEHFAIDLSLRQKGYGSKVLNEIINKYTQPFIIEVEPPTNVEALKRINFYIKLNFLLLDFNYLQPAYSPNQKSLPMQLMTNNSHYFTNENIQKAVSLIHQKVYKVL